MIDEFRALVSDTISFLKEEGKELILLPTQKTEAPLKLPSPLPVKPPPVEAPKAEQKLPPSPPHSMLEKIQKHLPHIAIRKEIPKTKCVGIVVTSKEDLDFLKSLAKAIQAKLCEVKLFEAGKKDLASFTLILSQESLPDPYREKTIILAPKNTYENNVEQKKKLWSEICGRL